MKSNETSVYSIHIDKQSKRLSFQTPTLSIWAFGFIACERKTNNLIRHCPCPKTIKWFASFIRSPPILYMNYIMNYMNHNLSSGLAWLTWKLMKHLIQKCDTHYIHNVNKFALFARAIHIKAAYPLPIVDWTCFYVYALIVWLSTKCTSVCKSRANKHSLLCNYLRSFFIYKTFLIGQIYFLLFCSVFYLHWNLCGRTICLTTGNRRRLLPHSFILGYRIFFFIFFSMLWLYFQFSTFQRRIFRILEQDRESDTHVIKHHFYTKYKYGSNSSSGGQMKFLIQSIESNTKFIFLLEWLFTLCVTRFSFH